MAARVCVRRSAVRVTDRCCTAHSPIRRTRVRLSTCATAAVRSNGRPSESRQQPQTKPAVAALTDHLLLAGEVLLGACGDRRVLLAEVVAVDCVAEGEPLLGGDRARRDPTTVGALVVAELRRPVVALSAGMRVSTSPQAVPGNADAQTKELGCGSVVQCCLRRAHRRPCNTAPFGVKTQPGVKQRLQAVMLTASAAHDRCSSLCPGPVAACSP